MLKTLICFLLLTTFANAASSLPRKGEQLDFSKIEKIFLSDEDIRYKAELAFLLSGSSANIKLQNSSIYYAKYALKFENELKMAQVCELRIVLGNYFQDLYSNEKANRYYKSISNKCSEKILNYAKMRIAWFKYNQGKKSKALSEFYEIYVVDKHNKQIKTKIGFVWADLFLINKESQIDVFSLMNDKDFHKGLREYFLNVKGGVITQDRIVSLFNNYPDVGKLLWNDLVVKKTKLCDLSFIKKIKGFTVFIEAQVKACEFSENVDSNQILASINSIENKSFNHYLSLGKHYKNLNQKAKSCHAFMNASTLLSEDNAYTAKGIYQTCDDLQKMRALFSSKYLKFPAMRQSLIFKLRDKFNMNIYNKVSKEFSNKEQNIILSGLVKTPERFSKVFREDIQLSESNAFNFIIFNNKKINKKTRDYFITKILSPHYRISLLGAGISSQIIPISDICKIEPAENIKTLFYLGIIKLKQAVAYQKCVPEFYMNDQMTLSSYINHFDFSEQDMEFKDGVLFTKEKVRLPHYTTLLPKENFREIRKELYLLKKINSVTLYSTAKILSEVDVFVQLKEFKLIKNQISKHIWRTEQLLKMAKFRLTKKIIKFEKNLMKTAFAKKETINFLGKLKDV